MFSCFSIAFLWGGSQNSFRKLGQDDDVMDEDKSNKMEKFKMEDGLKVVEKVNDDRKERLIERRVE